MDMTEKKKCERCGREITRGATDLGAGFALVGTRGRNAVVCYACCAEMDKLYMRRRGETTLYLVKVHAPEGLGLGSDWPHMETDGRKYRWEVTNWPGTLRFRCGVKVGRHNMSGKRFDAWFSFGGREWHGVNIGDNQLLRCRRTKRPA